MKALPKRKGNPQLRLQVLRQLRVASMKALPKRKGNEIAAGRFAVPRAASMKALPKRKGNSTGVPSTTRLYSPQ